MSETPCDIIIPVFNRLELTRNCLESIYAHTNTPFNLILIDNGSDSATRNFLENFKSLNGNTVLITNRDNLGWVKAVNQGLGLSSGRYVCIMNNDTIVRTAGWLSRLITAAESADDIGLVNPSFELKNAAAESAGPLLELDFCRGYCVLIKRKVIEKVGLLDASYGLGYYDDDDYSVRAIQAGFRCVRCGSVFVEHLRDSTFSALFDEEKRRKLHENNKRLFYSKWGRRLKVLLILTEDRDEKKLSEILFSLARRQHLVYLWGIKERPPFRHINIRQRTFPGFGNKFFISLALYSNRLKKESRRYDVVFVDSPSLNPFLSGTGLRLHYVDIEKDGSRIGEIARSASRVSYEM